MKFLSTAFVAASLSAFAVVPAAAEPVQLTIAYDDLDLSSPAGATKLAQRIETQVEGACERPFIRDLKAMRDYGTCVASARGVAAQTLAQMGVAQAS